MSAAVAPAAHNLAAASCRPAITCELLCPVNDAIYVIRSCICETFARLDSQKKQPKPPTYELAASNTLATTEQKARGRACQGVRVPDQGRCRS